jgi:hypothetical protein
MRGGSGVEAKITGDKAAKILNRVLADGGATPVRNCECPGLAMSDAGIGRAFLDSSGPGGSPRALQSLLRRASGRARKGVALPIT